jgi:hypothetical protein
MSVTVVFRGVMLFHVQGEEFKQVLMPRCAGVVPPYGYTERGRTYHLDGSEARPHYPRMLIASATETVDLVDLDNSEVAIGSGNLQYWGVASEFVNCAATGDVVGKGSSSLELDPDVTPAARVVIHEADTALAKLPAEYKCKMGEQEPAHVLEFEYPSPLEIVVTRGASLETRFTIESGLTVYILNVDVPEPTVKDVTDETPTNLPVLIDHDFKWIYSLLKPVSGDDLMRWANGSLPAPVLNRGISPATITVSTCFPGWI